MILQFSLSCVNFYWPIAVSTKKTIYVLPRPLAATSPLKKLGFCCVYASISTKILTDVPRTITAMFLKGVCEPDNPSVPWYRRLDRTVSMKWFCALDRNKLIYTQSIGLFLTLGLRFTLLIFVEIECPPCFTHKEHTQARKYFLYSFLNNWQAITLSLFISKIRMNYKLDGGSLYRPQRKYNGYICPNNLNNLPYARAKQMHIE